MKGRYITIKKTEDEDRLDKVIHRHLTGVSRSTARRWIEEGAVQVDGMRIRRQSYIVTTGQTVAIYTPVHPDLSDSASQQSTASRCTSGSLIIHEDPWYLVIHKPAGMPAEETLQGRAGTLPHILETTLGYSHIALVHRLDMGTSGIMVVSRKAAATRELNRQFRDHSVEKKYVAIVRGVPYPTPGSIENHLERDPDDPRKMTSRVNSGKHAVTQYEVLATAGEVSLLTVTILTGRKHQIRVHLSERGHPVAGDRLYGSPDDASPRLMLHAWQLAFDCPRTGERRWFSAPVPSVFFTWSGIAPPTRAQFGDGPPHNYS
ncbi:RluA family pseudouridine synthase [bacterium]|nr:RluA family pseudouridine synthase [candidate division CSSED10-310 bacterium]